MRLRFLATAAVLSAVIAQSTVAATVSENLYFDLTGFVDIGTNNIAPPVSEVTGSFTVTFDPAMAYNNDTTDIVVHTLTGVTVDSPLGFTYSAGTHLLEFGGTANNSDYVYAGTNDLVVAFNLTNLAAPTYPTCAVAGYYCGPGAYTYSPLVVPAGYTEAAYPADGWFYGVQSVASTAPIPPTTPPVTPPTTGVPEPATLGLIGLGLAGLALARRKRLI